MIGSFIEVLILTWVMSGGSSEKEDPIDQQCQYCGRWYHTAGLNAHEQNCDFQEVEVRLHKLEDSQTIARASIDQ